jgi:hypothetical protein
MENRGDMGPVHEEQGRYGSCSWGIGEIWVLFMGNNGNIWVLFMGYRGDIGPIHGVKGR